MKNNGGEVTVNNCNVVSSVGGGTTEVGVWCGKVGGGGGN